MPTNSTYTVADNTTFRSGFIYDPVMNPQYWWEFAPGTYSRARVVRLRTGFSSGIIPGSTWKKPTNYNSAFIRYNYPPFDFRYKEGNYFKRNLGTTACGFAFGGPDGILGHIDHLRFVTETGGIQPLLWDQNVVDRTVTEALAEAQQSKINAAVSLAEMDAAITMIANSMRTILNAWKAARNMNLRGLAQALGFDPQRTSWLLRSGVDTAANAWLQTTYGWKPLLSDIYGACAALEKGMRDEPAPFYAESSAGKRPTGLERGKPTGFSLWRDEIDVQCSCRTRLYFKVADPWVATLDSFGVTNPFLIAWELVPFSFVLDWLIPVGNWLQALTSTWGLDYLGGYTTYRIDLSEQVTATKIPFENFRGGVFPVTAMNIVAFNRIARDSLPVPRIYWKNPFSRSHVTSALALLHQLRR